MLPLGRLGPLLLQFPWSFRYSEGSKRWLRNLVAAFNDLPLVVEVRSTGWVQPEAVEFMRGLGVGFCNIDQPRFRNNIPLTEYGFGRVGYLRLHGRNYENWFSDQAGRDERYDYLYGSEERGEIRQAVERIARKVEQIYV